MADNFSTQGTGLDSAYRSVVAITPHDTTELTDTTRAIYVGGAGNAAVLMADGTTATFTGLLAGHVYRLRIRRVNSTNTTATALLALY